MSRASSVAGSRVASSSRMSRASAVGSRASGIGSNISGMSSAVSGFSSALSTIGNLNSDKRIFKKVLPYDIVFMQKLLNVFNLVGLVIGLLVLAGFTCGLMFALNETCLKQPYHAQIVPTTVEHRANGYTCTGNRLIAKSDKIPKMNMIIIVTGLFFAVQAKLFGFMGSSFMVMQHLFTYVLFFLFAYILIGIAALIELGTSE